MYKCLQCNNMFLDNDDGIADNGLSRPRCPNCFEEVDIDMSPLASLSSDYYHEYAGHTDEIDDLIDAENEGS